MCREGVCCRVGKVDLGECQGLFYVGMFLVVGICLCVVVQVCVACGVSVFVLICECLELVC